MQTELQVEACIAASKFIVVEVIDTCINVSGLGVWQLELQNFQFFFFSNSQDL